MKTVIDSENPFVPVGKCVNYISEKGAECVRVKLVRGSWTLVKNKNWQKGDLTKEGRQGSCYTVYEKAGDKRGIGVDKVNVKGEVYLLLRTGKWDSIHYIFAIENPETMKIKNGATMYFDASRGARQWK